MHSTGRGLGGRGGGVIRQQWRVGQTQKVLDQVWCLWKGHWGKGAKSLTSSFCSFNLNLQCAHSLPPPPYDSSNLSLLAPHWISPSSLAALFFFLFSSLSAKKKCLAALLAWKVAIPWKDSSGNWLKVDLNHRRTTKDASVTCPVDDVTQAFWTSLTNRNRNKTSSEEYL